MDGLVKELLRLESAKHKALIEIDASAYDTHVQSQLRLLSVSNTSAGNVTDITNVEQLLALSQLITLNTRLLQNLISTSPLFAFSKNGYTAKGQVAIPSIPQRVSVEA
jgi:hypothetical protein